MIGISFSLSCSFYLLTLQVQSGVSEERDPLDALAMRYIISASQGELQVNNIKKKNQNEIQQFT